MTINQVIIVGDQLFTWTWH